MKEFKKGDLVTLLPRPPSFNSHWAKIILCIHTYRMSRYYGSAVAVPLSSVIELELPEKIRDDFMMKAETDCRRTTLRDLLIDFKYHKLDNHLDAIREILNAEI